MIQLERFRFKARAALTGLSSDVAQRAGPTTAELKHDIDSGLTGDKVQLYDPSVAPLGSDDEAAGRPPSPRRVALARRHELWGRWSRSAFQNSGLRPRHGPALPLFIAFTILVALVLAVGVALARGQSA